MDIGYILSEASQPALPKATDSHAPVIDHLRYPHIFEQIFQQAEYPALVSFRATCHSLRERVDRRLSAHLLVLAGGMHILTMGRHAVPSLAINRPGHEWSNPKRARFLLSRTQVVDYVGSFNFPTHLESVMDDLRPTFARVWGETEGNRLPSSIDTLVVFGWSSPCRATGRHYRWHHREMPFLSRRWRNPILSTVNLDPTTMVLNLSISGKRSMNTVSELMPSLGSEGVRDIVIIIHCSEGRAFYQEDSEGDQEEPPGSDIVAVKDLETILRFIKSRWLTSPTTPRIIIVDLHLISPDEPKRGFLRRALRDYARLRAGDCPEPSDIWDGPEPSDIEFYNQSPGNVVSKAFSLPDDSITLMSKQEYSAQIGQERFRFYTDESFFLK